MIAIINFILVPLWSLHRPPVCFSVSSYGSQEKVLWHFQATSATGRFRECKTLLGTSATAWICRGWAGHRIEARVQDGLSWDMVSGHWEVSRAQGSSSYFHPLKGSSGIWYTLWELWSLRHTVIIPGSSTTVCQAWLHLPVLWSPCWAGDGREGIKLSVKAKATSALWLSWFISGAVWQSQESSARAEHTQPGVQPREGPRIV